MSSALQVAVNPDAIDVDPTAEVEKPWRLIRAGLLGALLLILGFSAWVGLAPLAAAVIATGHVKVDMNRRTVQHQEGGLVSEVLVRDGAKVKAGQTLIVMRDVRVEASNDLVRTQLDAELAKAARLTAEQSGAATVSFPVELQRRAADRRVAELIAQESRLFEVRRGSLENQLHLIRAQITETRQEVRARTVQIKADDAALTHHADEIAANQALAGQGFVSKTRMTMLMRAASEYESRRAQNMAELSKAEQRIAELELRASSLAMQFKQEATTEFRQATAAIFDLRQRLRPAQDAEQRQRIVAPISGEIIDLKVTTPGTVIGPREAILDIVPEDAELIIEARVRPEDISYIKLGATADVRLTAFRQRVTPTVQGTLHYISADRLMEKAPGAPAYYVAHVRVALEELQRAGNLKLQAGMPAEVFIQTNARTGLEYLLDPILGFLQRSMREQ
jgi:membrane fusion protein, epimerase transport system